MTIRKILRAGQPSLRRTSEEVDPDHIGDEAFSKLITDMFETMRDADGVGLAAPQVQDNLRVVVYEIEANERYEDLDERVPPTVLLNPTVLDASEEMVTDWEGCLSLPELRGKVPRHRWIHLRARDETGNTVDRRVEGFESRVIQHELDHLDGTLYVDRMDSMESLSFLREYRRFQAEAPPEGGDSTGDTS